MRPQEPCRFPALHLKAGDWVEVRSREEILATLDEEGCLEGLPFMSEMLQHCGQRLQVFKSAHKTCDYLQGWSIRRMKDAVHLAGVRCDGSGHDGCQASCLIFWKEAWLKRAEGNLVTTDSLRLIKTPGPDTAQVCTVKTLALVSKVQNAEGKTVYRCQVTDVPKFTSRMSFWDPRQYIQDLRSGNLLDGLGSSSRAQRLLEFILASIRLLHATVIGFFNEVQGRRNRSPYPLVHGTGPIENPGELDLQPGELVEVRSREEIMSTLDNEQKERGLWFDSEMLPYCGGIYRVHRRVDRIIDERSRRMIKMKYPSIVLEGVVCKADFHRLCPRSIYPYWRESWLKRANVQIPGEVSEACQ